MTWAVSAVAAVAAAATIASTISSASAAAAAANAQEQSVKTQELTNEYKIVKQKNKEMTELHVQLAENQMTIANRGLSSQSPSFNALQMDTYNKTADALTEGTTAIKIDRLSAQSQIESIHKIASAQTNSAYFQGIGKLAQLGMSAYSYGSGYTDKK